MDSDNLFEGLNMFTQGLQKLQVSRSLSSANDAVEQIRNSEAAESDKNQQLRNVAQGLTFQLAAQGVPGSTLQTLAGFAPARPNPQNVLEAYAAGGAYKDAAKEYTKDLMDTKLKEQEAKYDALLRNSTSLQGLKNDGKSITGATKEDTANFNKLADDLKNNDSIRTVPGLVAKTSNRLQAVENALNSASPGDPVYLQTMNEAALGIASALKQGQVNLEDVKAFTPSNVASDKAKAISYFENVPPTVQTPEVLQYYKGLLQREHNLASQQLEDSVYKTANRRNTAFKGGASDASKAAIAASLPGVNPEDVYQKPNGQVTWKQREQTQSDISSINTSISKAKTALNSSDPKVQQAAASYFQRLKLDPKDPIDALQRQVEFNVRAGKYAGN